MPFEHFLIPFSGGPAQEELNRFLGTHRILQIDRRQVENGWAYCLEYGESKIPQEKPPFRKNDKKPDDGYEERLGPDGFRLYLKLKDWRKDRGERDKVPRLFKIFSNAQLADIAEQRCRTMEELQAIEGVGEGRCKDYGEEVLKVIAEHEAGD